MVVRPARIVPLRRAVAALAALLLVGLAILAQAGPAAAWGDMGYRVMGDLAYARLTPAARAQVDAMIAAAPVSGEPSCPVASLADAAVFPGCVDGIRRYNDLRKSRDEDQPVCPAQARGDPCKDGQCPSGAVKRALAVLADPARQAPARLYALEQLSRAIADLHQPFDMVDNRDDHARDIRVVLPGSSDKHLNLHDFWTDIVLAPALGADEGTAAAWLQPVVAGDRGWETGDVDAWAGETATLARVLYSRLPEEPQCGRNPRNPEALDRTYVEAAVPIAREQLARAAVRLAALLNQTLH